MRSLARVSLVVAVVIAVGCKAKDRQAPAPEPAPEPVAKPAAAADLGGFTISAPAKLSYSPLDPNNPKGPELAVVHGNPMAGGASAFFLRVPGGGDAGLHSHTAGYHAIAVSGKPKHWLPGEDKVAALTPGSYWAQPGGQAHGDSCDGPDPCVLFIVMDGKFDFIPTPDAKPGDPGGYKLVKLEDAKFAPFDPKQEAGAQAAMLGGDPQAGPVAFHLEVPAGGSSGLHSHTSDYHAVVLAGTPSHWVDGGDGENATHEAGTYWFQPGGQVHGDACRGTTACRLFVFMPKPLDMIPKPVQ